MHKAALVQDDPQAALVDYAALYCRLAKKTTKDLKPEEHHAIRCWRLAVEYSNDGYGSEQLRVCSACGWAYPWKRTEQRFVATTNR